MPCLPPLYALSPEKYRFLQRKQRAALAAVGCCCLPVADLGEGFVLQALRSQESCCSGYVIA